MSGDIDLCEHFSDANTCEICKQEGKEFRERVKAGLEPCPICNNDEPYLGLCNNGLIVHKDSEGWVIRRYDEKELLDSSWDVWTVDGWGSADCMGFKGGYASYTSRDEALKVAESLNFRRK